ncbi:hypothetical protein KC901_02250 [Patescibacteria group bacterium]|nr:hypothetical protein [Patescibacteria group bacterium]
MTKKSKTDYERIVDWLKKQPENTTFKSSKVAQELKISLNKVSLFLSRKKAEGYLENISGTEKFSIFKILNSNISVRKTSKGELSDMVFNILRELNVKFPNGYVREPLIKKKLEELTNKKISLNSIHAIVQRWFDSGYLKRNSNPKGYGYRIKNEYLNSQKRFQTVSKK